MKKKTRLFITCLLYCMLASTAYGQGVVKRQQQSKPATQGSTGTVKKNPPFRKETFVANGLKYETISSSSVSVEGIDASVNIQELSIPKNVIHRGTSYKVAEIGYQAFYNCDYLTYVTLPESLTKIGNYAFFGTKIRSINIPSTLNDINEYTFWGCSELKYIGVDEKNQQYSSIDGVLYSKDGSELILFPPKTGKVKFVIPSHVRKIACDAIQNKTDFLVLTIPPTVEYGVECMFTYYHKIGKLILSTQHLLKTINSFDGEGTTIDTLVIAGNIEVEQAYNAKIEGKSKDLRELFYTGKLPDVIFVVHPNGNEEKIYESEEHIREQAEKEPKMRELALKDSIEREQLIAKQLGLEQEKINALAGDYTDLGLSSGTLWATRNIGANSPEEYGDYFAWGEVSRKSVYDYVFKKYKWRKGINDYKKYNNKSNYGLIDNKMELDLVDDAAYVNLGSHWRIPTYDQIEELKKECKWTWITCNGVKGCSVKGPNGNSIFLPAAGDCAYRVYLDYSSLDGEGSYCHYWSSSLDYNYPFCAYELFFSPSSGFINHHHSRSRPNGFSIRPVRAQK